MSISPKQNRVIIDNQQKILESHTKHLEIANYEMGVVKTDIAWIKDSIRTHGTLLWSILGTMILGTLISIALRIFT